MVDGVDRADQRAFAGVSIRASEIDVPLSDARFRELNFSVEEDGALLVAFDASLFHDDTTGNLEYRFYTPLAREFVKKLKEKTDDRKQETAQ